MNEFYLNDFEINPYIAFFRRISSDEKEAMLAHNMLCKVLESWEIGDTFVELCSDEIKQIPANSKLFGNQDTDNTPLILQGNRLFLGKIRAMEKFCAKRIYELSQSTKKQSFDIEPLLDKYFPDKSHLAQKEAARLAFSHSFLLITGGPGTGKTTTVAKILNIFCQANQDKLPSIALAAPTGKAASHLQASLSKWQPDDISPKIQQHLSELKGKTLHRLLELNQLMRAKYNSQNPLPFDIVIVDEASMIDLSLMNKLLAAISSNTTLILLGDADQLPSVGAGSVLSEMVQNSDIVPTCHLTYSHRFNENSAIGNLAYAVLENNQNHIKECFNQFKLDLQQFSKTKYPLYSEWFEIQKDYWQAVKSGSIKDAICHIQDAIVLSVLRHDAQKFNREYIKFIKQKFQIDEEYFSGRLLLITKNKPSEQIYNGDIGIVMYDNKTKRQRVWFSENHAVDISMLGEFEDAFAITVHKSQGSEYKQVALIGTDLELEHELFNASLLYTAITRAKQKFTYLGSMESLLHATCARQKRKSVLGEFLTTFR